LSRQQRQSNTFEVEQDDSHHDNWAEHHSFEHPINMQPLVHNLGVSYSHFRMVFNASTGLPSQQYLLNLRINRAKQLMEEAGTKLSDVARRGINAHRTDLASNVQA